MLATRRWRDWEPSAIFQECPERELTKPTEPLPSSLLSVLSVQSLLVSETNTPWASIQPHDLAMLREPFSRWLDSFCVRSPRCFSGVADLHIAFCEWVAKRSGTPCDRETFERLLTELGFLVGEVSGVVLVSGLTFLEDFESYK